MPSTGPAIPVHVRDGKVVNPLKSLDAKAATGAGTVYQLPGGFATFGIQGKLSTGGSTKAVVRLQGSIDGTNYVNLTAATTWSATSAASKSTAAIPVNFVRLNIISFTTRAGTTAADVATVNGWIAVQS